jgi:large-conductance mechanosensitive channel
MEPITILLKDSKEKVRILTDAEKKFIDKLRFGKEHDNFEFKSKIAKCWSKEDKPQVQDKKRNFKQILSNLLLHLLTPLFIVILLIRGFDGKVPFIQEIMGDVNYMRYLIIPLEKAFVLFYGLILWLALFMLICSIIFLIYTSYASSVEKSKIKKYFITVGALNFFKRKNFLKAFYSGTLALVQAYAFILTNHIVLFILSCILFLLVLPIKSIIKKQVISVLLSKKVSN